MIQSIDYFPIEYLFNLLSLCRKGAGETSQKLSNALSKRDLWSLVGRSAAGRPVKQLSFWLRLAQGASLLSEGPPYFPTLLTREWLSWPYLDQMAFLVNAWLIAPQSNKLRQMRKNLLHRLIDAGGNLSRQFGLVHRREMTGLQALGICDDCVLSPLGLAITGETESEKYTSSLPEPWSLSGDQLIVPYPPDWGLLWDLESCLEPAAAGVYPVDPGSLRLALQLGKWNDPNLFIGILEQGFLAAPPDWLVERLGKEPSIRVIPGPILEFSDPEELKALRRSPGFKRDLESLLSHRHAALDPWRAWQVLRKLQRRGMVSESDLSAASKPAPAPEWPACRLNKADRVYLLSLMLLSEGLQNIFAPPPGLLARLVGGMDPTLRASAARRATAALALIKPKPEWQPEEEPPPQPPEEMLNTIQHAINREESIDVMYRATGRHMAEYRHLTPLLIEARGERHYLIAYCHLRRANRTFRLDRMKLIDSPPI